MAAQAERSDPLWLRVVVALLLSCTFSALVLLMMGDLLGRFSLVLCGGLALVSTVVMAWKGKRVSKIATWFFEAVSGI